MKQRIPLIVFQLLLGLLLLSSGAWAQDRPLAPASHPVSAAPPAGPVVMVGQVGGGMTAVAVQGTTAYVGQGAHLTTLDIADPAHPLLLGRSAPIPTGVSGIAISDTLACVASLEGGVYTVDVSDPAQPAILGRYDTAGTAVTVVMAGPYAYVADGESGLAILDLTDPANISQVGLFPANQSFYEDVVVSGVRAYATDLSGLVIIDISNPAAPSQLRYISMTGLGKGTSGVAVSGSYAFVGVQLLTGSTLRSINVNSPGEPVHSVSLSGNAGRLAMAGDHVYVSLGASGVQAVDVYTPTTPIAGTVYNTPGNPWILAAADGYLHLADECGGYRIATLADPAQPQNLDATDDSLGVYRSVGCVTRVAAAGHYAYINGDEGFVVVDATDPAQAFVAGTLPQATAGLAVSGEHAYVADGASGGSLHIINVAAPAAPQQVGALALAGAPSAVALQGSYAYVTGQNTGLRVIDVTNPITPTLYGSRAISGAGNGVAVSGNIACIAAGSAGLRVLNVSNPASPGTPVVSDTVGSALDVAISGSLAYVADDEGGLRIADLSTPTSPVERGFYTATVQASSVVVDGEYVYLADGYSGVSLIDAFDPAKPFEFTNYETLDTASDVALVGDLLYVANNVGGLLILRVTLPTPLRPDLDEAWNLFSFNIEPISATVPLTDVRSILLSIDGQYTSVLGYDQGALSYYADLDPAFNDLKELDWRHGYWIKMSQAATLKLKGWPVDPTTPLALDAGWNLVSYLPSEPIAVPEAMASIDGQYTSVLGFHDGGAVSYYSDLDPEFNDLQCLRPQNGYWIRTITETTLIYPTAGTCAETAPTAARATAQGPVRRAAIATGGAATAEQAVRPEARAVAAEAVTPTYLWWDVYSTDTRCAGATILEGTIIQARDPQGIICGYAVAHGPGAWGVMHVYGDDPTTAEDEGAESGDLITFTINGQPAQVHGQSIWQQRGRQELQLASASCGPRNYLPTIQ